jgi:AraC-like DNA-binding protein
MSTTGLTELENKIQIIENQLKKRFKDWTDDEKEEYGNHEQLREEKKLLREEKKQLRDEKNLQLQLQLQASKNQENG